MSTHDIIAAANEGNPSEFQAAVQDELNARIMAQLDIEREQLADSIFAKDVEEVDMGPEDEDVNLEFDFGETETEEEAEDEDV